jgi:hypothetical protein
MQRSMVPSIAQSSQTMLSRTSPRIVLRAPTVERVAWPVAVS